MHRPRKYPIGAEAMDDLGTHFRVWAPRSRTVAVELIPAAGNVERQALLSPESGGYFSGWVEGARPGALYRYRLDQGSFPDPASRAQPDGPHGPSQIVASDFAWTDQAWRGRPATEIVLYELHLGTFTPGGTWRSALERLPELAGLGITAVEIMPIAEMPGSFGWGYDGVDLFAPTRLYGTPEDVRTFINRAHELGLMVILDVVYNHLGPDGNYLAQYSGHYFTAKHICEWGEAINFDDEQSRPVREFFITNAVYWIDEFHFDGLRLDATQQIFDSSKRHILSEIAEAVRAAAPNRSLFLVAENDVQESRLARATDQGGYGLDAIWNDDFHHSAMVAATGRAEAYYVDYRGTAQELLSAAKHGFLYQGSWNQWQQRRRGHPARGLLRRQFVIFLQNHDQVANTLHGWRLHQRTSPGRFRALTALSLLIPATPMLFQGQEFGASAPFHYFADHHPELGRLVMSGRHRFMGQFRSIAAEDAADLLADPADPQTYLTSKLDWAERQRNQPLVDLHHDLLKLRREDPTIRSPSDLDGAVLDREAFVLRYFSATGRDLLLIVNLGADLTLRPIAEPLLAPCENRGWRLLWSSEAPRYQGAGTPELETTSGWMLPGHAAILLQPSEGAGVARVASRDGG